MSEHFNSNTNQNLNTNNTADAINLAAHIDTSNAVDPNRYHTPKVPQMASEAVQDTREAPQTQSQEQPQHHRFPPIKRFSYPTKEPCGILPPEGTLLEGKLTKAELLNDRNGNPFLKVTVTTNSPANWNLVHCHFFSKKQATSPEAVMQLTEEYLRKFNYQVGTNDYSHTMCLIQIGEWISDDGRKHSNAKKLFRDAADYDNYFAWLQRKQQQQQQTNTANTLWPAI